MLYDCYIDIRNHRPPPALQPVTRAEAQRMAHERFEARVHADAPERARILVAIGDEIDARGMLRADATQAMRLVPGSLDDQSLSTAQLRAALDVMRGLPTP